MKYNYLLLTLMLMITMCSSAFSQNKASNIFTAEDLMSVKRISEPKISPDGKWILYCLTIPNIDENKNIKDLYIISVDGKLRKQITNDVFADYSALWSNDGKYIAFISTRTGTPQIWTYNIETYQLKQVTTMEEGVDNLLYSPDGKYFSFTSDVKVEQTLKDKYPKLQKANVMIYNKLPIRHWNEWTDEKCTHLFIVPIDGGTPKDLMPNEAYETPIKPNGGVEDISWSPESNEIAYACKKLSGYEYVRRTHSDIYVVNINSGATRNIAESQLGTNNAPSYSPDGNWLAFHSQERDGFESDRIRLMLYNRKNNEIKELSKTLDQWVGEVIWAPDSHSLYFSAEDTGKVHLYQMQVADGTWKIITKGWFDYGLGIDISKDGKTLVFGRQNMVTPLEIFTMPTSLASEPIQVTHENTAVFEKYKTAKMEERWIKSKDGKKVHCWIMFPPDFDANKKYPMITFCQGGPQSMISQDFHFRWNFYLMASQGYVILMPNRRGMPGFGQEWNDAISKNWGGLAMQDILYATDELCTEKYIDKDNLAAVGASAGGFTIFWLEGNHNKRFKAMISHCGVFDFTSQYGATEELWFPDWEYGGPYWDKKYKSNYDKNSPHNFVQNWDTPIMISTGEHDFRVPYTQSLEAFTAAQAKGLPTKLVIFPEETHFISHPQEFILWNTEFFEFLDTYCKKK